MQRLRTSRMDTRLRLPLQEEKGWAGGKNKDNFGQGTTSVEKSRGLILQMVTRIETTQREVRRNHRGFCGAVRCGLYHLPQRLKGRLSRQLVAGALHNELFPVLHGPYSGEANGDNIAFRKHQNFIWLPVLHHHDEFSIG